MAVSVSFPRPAHRANPRIRSSKKQKTTNQWRCGPTSISGSVLLCPVLFCELKPFYRSQWPFSCGSHAPFSDESSSADMFSSKQYLLSHSDDTEAPSCRFLGTPHRPELPSARIHLPYIITDSCAFVKPPAELFCEIFGFFLFSTGSPQRLWTGCTVFHTKFVTFAADLPSFTS